MHGRCYRQMMLSSLLRRATAGRSSTASSTCCIPTIKQEDMNLLLIVLHCCCTSMQHLQVCRYVAILPHEFCDSAMQSAYQHSCVPDFLSVNDCDTCSSHQPTHNQNLCKQEHIMACSPGL